MSNVESMLDVLFVKARTFYAWKPREVTDVTLKSLYEALKWGPTSLNCCPSRFVFVKSAATKEKLISCLLPGNVEKVKTAPVTAIIATDEKFYDQIPKLFPQAAQYRDIFKNDPALAQSTGLRNGSLQGAYLILAARTLGLDCGPISGFDAERLDGEFFKGTSWKSNFICNLGYGDASQLFPRLPRLNFEEVCKIV